MSHFLDGRVIHQQSLRCTRSRYAGGSDNRHVDCKRAAFPVPHEDIGGSPFWAISSSLLQLDVITGPTQNLEKGVPKGRMPTADGTCPLAANCMMAVCIGWPAAVRARIRCLAERDTQTPFQSCTKFRWRKRRNKGRTSHPCCAMRNRKRVQPCAVNL